MAETHHFDVRKLYNLKGFVAVVTGGGTGIGLMASQALAQNGATVYITGRRAEVLEKSANVHDPESGGSINALPPTDVTKKEDLERCVSDVQKKEKHINLLICNAGIASSKAEPKHENGSKLKDTLWSNESFEDWDNTYRTNVSAVYFTTVAFLPLLQAGLKPNGPLDQFSTSVIVISSMSGQISDSQGHFSYNASKGATVQLTKLMSAEFQKAGVRINSIAPGYFPSEMTTHGESDEKNKSELPADKVQEKGHVPAERAGKDTEMGMTVLFLAKNGYINGQIVTVDGGVLNVLGGS